MLFNFHSLFVKICLGVLGFVILVQVATVAFAPISAEPRSESSVNSTQQLRQPASLSSTESGSTPGSELFRTLIGVALVAGVMAYIWRPTHKEWVLYEV